MKYLFILLFISTPLYADSNELIVGGITYHIISSKAVDAKFSNKIGSDGALIATPTLGFTKGYESLGEYTSLSGFVAENSVGKPSGGLVFETGEVFGKLQVGLAMGGYLQNNQEFRRRNIAPFSIAQQGEIGLVPVAGLAINYKIPINNNTFIRFNNILTPVMTNHSVSLGREF